MAASFFVLAVEAARPWRQPASVAMVGAVIHAGSEESYAMT